MSRALRKAPAGLKASPARVKASKSGMLLTVRDWRAAVGSASIDDLVADWRWRSRQRIRVEKRLGASVPLELREAADAFKRATGCNLSEIQRRALSEFFKRLGGKRGL